MKPILPDASGITGKAGSQNLILTHTVFDDYSIKGIERTGCR